MDKNSMSFFTLKNKADRERLVAENEAIRKRLKKMFLDEKLGDQRLTEEREKRYAPVIKATQSLGQNLGKKVDEGIKKASTVLSKDKDATEIPIVDDDESSDVEDTIIVERSQTPPTDYPLSTTAHWTALSQQYGGNQEKIIEEIDKNLNLELIKELETFVIGNSKGKGKGRGISYTLLPPSELWLSKASTHELQKIQEGATKLCQGKLGSQIKDLNRQKKYGKLSKEEAEEAIYDIKGKIKDINLYRERLQDIIDLGTSYKGAGFSVKIEPTNAEKRCSCDGKNASPNIVMQYYTDPNELVERLALLVAAKNSGNNGVLDEISAIIDELHKQDLITKDNVVNLNKCLLT